MPDKKKKCNRKGIKMKKQLSNNPQDYIDLIEILIKIFK